MTAAAPTATARDAALVKGIGTLALAGNFIGYVVGAGIFTAPREVAASVGGWGPVAYLVCGIATSAILLCFAEASARAPGSGGVYGFVGTALGPFWGWQAGALVWVSNVLASAAVAAAAADATGTLVPALAGGPVRVAAICGWFALLVIVNIMGVGFASRFVAASALVKLLPLAVFVGVGAFFIHPANLTLPPPAGHADIGRAAFLVLFMFIGVEGGLSVAGEVRDPVRSIPRAILLSMLVATSFYIGIQTVAQGLAGAALAVSPAPLAAALGRVSPGLGTLMVLGALVSMLGYLAGDAMSSPRCLFAFARDGFIPSAFGRVDGRHVPRLAVIAHCALCAVGAVTGGFAALAILSTLAVVALYVLGCAAALRLRARGVEQAGPVAPLPGLKAAALLGFACMGWIAAQSTGAEALMLAGFMAAASLLFMLRRRIVAGGIN